MKIAKASANAPVRLKTGKKNTSSNRTKQVIYKTFK